MSEEIYQKLQACLDEYSIGFNSTRNHREMDILKVLFTPEEAEMYLFLKRALEPVAVIAQRAGRSEEDTARILEEMTQKGHTFPDKKNGKAFYAAAPFMHGIFENAVALYENRPELKELAAAIDDYLKDGFRGKGPSLRTIPVGMEIKDAQPIAPFDDLKKIVESKEKIGVFSCACAVKSNAIGKKCEQDLSVCIGFDFYAQYGVEHLKIGRYISQQEALEILKATEEAGFVHQLAGDSRNTEGICNCCPDCCNILPVLRKLPEPAKYAQTNYAAHLDVEACINCETCIDRCPMEALSTGDETVSLQQNRCIGCGLCVSTCPSEALTLVLKPEDGPREFLPGKYKFMRSSLDFKEDMASHS